MDKNVGGGKAVASRAGQWVCKACGADKCWASTKVCYKCGANRPKVKGRKAPRARKAEVPSQGAEDKSGELEKLRATLVATKKLAAEQGMSDVYESAINSLSAKVEALQAAKESTVPKCITEVAVTRKITFDERRKTKAEEKIVELEKKRDEVDKEIMEQKERLAAIEDRLKSSREKKAALAKPTVGQGWESTVEHLESALEAITAGAEDASQVSANPAAKNIAAALAEAKKAKEAASRAPPPATGASASGGGGGAAGKRGEEATVTAGQAEKDIVVVLEAAGWTGPDAAKQAKSLASIAADMDVDSTIVVKRRSAARRRPQQPVEEGRVASRSPRRAPPVHAGRAGAGPQA